MTVPLSATGFSGLATSLDQANRIVEISGDLTEGNNTAAVKRAIAAGLGLANSAMGKVGGVISLVSTPVIKDGKLMMKVQFPVAVIKGEPRNPDQL